MKKAKKNIVQYITFSNYHTRFGLLYIYGLLIYATVVVIFIKSVNNTKFESLQLSLTSNDLREHTDEKTVSL
jgi:hypothetical protein